MTNQSTTLEGGAMPSSVKFNTLTSGSMDRALKAMEYDMAKERVEPYIVDMTKELPEVLPLIKKGALVAEGTILKVPRVTKSQSHRVTESQGVGVV